MNTNTDIKTTVLGPQLQLSGISKQLAASLAGVDKLTGQIAAQRPLAKMGRGTTERISATSASRPRTSA